MNTYKVGELARISTDTTILGYISRPNAGATVRILNIELQANKYRVKVLLNKKEFIIHAKKLEKI